MVVDEAFGGADQGVEDIAALLLGCGDDGAQYGEVIGVAWGSEAAGDFLSQFHHAQVALGLIVGEGDLRVDKEAQRLVAVSVQAQGKIVALAPLRLPAPAGRGERRQALMEGHRLDKQCVIAPFEARLQSLRNRYPPRPRPLRHTPRPAQKMLEAARPRLLVEIDRSLQLPKMVRVAKPMLHPRHRPVALPVVMHRYPRHTLGHGTPLLRHTIRRQARRAHHMKPMRATLDPKPGLVQMLHARPDRRKRLYMPGGRTQATRSTTAHRPQRRRRYARPEQNLQNLTQATLWKELRMAKPHRNPRKLRTILHRGRDTRGEPGSRHNPATGAAARMTAMLRHFQRTRHREVEYLTRNRRPNTSRSRQRRPAAPANRGNVICNPVRERHPAKRPALMTLLATRLAARLAPQALCATVARRLLQTVARWRLAAVGAVQTETALQRRYPILKTRVPLSKMRVLKLKTRDLLNGRLRPRQTQRVKRLGTNHHKVDSFFDPAVNPSWPVTVGLDREIRAAARQDEEVGRLMAVPGIGPITAMAVQAFAPPMETFRRGRDFAAWLGLVPRQHTTGGKPRLGKISKMGQRDLRRLLITGAMAVVRWAARRGRTNDPWLARMLMRKPRMLVAVALANRMARIVWALMTKKESYRAPVAA